MIDRHHDDPAAQAELSEQDLAIAALVGHLAAAAEFGDTAVDVLRTVLACYEAMRAHGDDDPRPSRDRPASAGELRSKP